MEKKIENELKTVIIMGYIRVLLGLYRRNRKDNGSYYLGFRVQDLGLELYMGDGKEQGKLRFRSYYPK